MWVDPLEINKTDSNTEKEWSRNLQDLGRAAVSWPLNETTDLAPGSWWTEEEEVVSWRGNSSVVGVAAGNDLCLWVGFTMPGIWWVVWEVAILSMENFEWVLEIIFWVWCGRFYDVRDL